MSPYRTPANGPARPAEEDGERCPDADLLPLLLLLGAAILVRATVALVRGMTLGTEGAVAVFALAAVPYLAKDALGWWIRRCRKRFRE